MWYYVSRMATIDKQDILSALARLGELAAAKGEQLDLLLLGWEDLHGKS